MSNKKGFETKLTLSQEDMDSPVQFQMDWSPSLAEFAHHSDEDSSKIPATHLLMQNIFMNTLLPLTGDDATAEVEVSHTIQ